MDVKTGMRCMLTTMVSVGPVVRVWRVDSGRLIIEGLAGKFPDMMGWVRMLVLKGKSSRRRTFGFGFG